MSTNILSDAQRKEFIRRTSFISEADRDMRTAFVDEIVNAVIEKLGAGEVEPTAFSVLNKRSGRHWYTNESKYTAQHYANEYSHREPDGSPSMVVMPLYDATALAHARQQGYEAARAEFAEDAGRYRWLRMGGITHSTDLDVVDDDGNVLTAEELDAAIDAARQSTIHSGESRVED